MTEQRESATKRADLYIETLAVLSFAAIAVLLTEHYPEPWDIVFFLLYSAVWWFVIGAYAEKWDLLGRLRIKFSHWRMKRARRRAAGHRRERKRLERKYESEADIPPLAFVYELFRAALVGLKLKVKP